MREILCIVVLFVISVSALSYQTPDNAAMDKCMTKHSVSKDILIDLHSNPEHLFKDPTLRCLAACILIENKTLNPDGSLDAVTLIENMPMNIFEREKVAEAFNACANETGADLCEKAHKTVECLSSKEAIRNIRPAA